MSTSFDLPSPDVFTAGTVGPPGQRVFYLQVREDALTITLRCEKQQVAALAEYFDGLLDDLEPAPYGLASPDLDLAEPIHELWTVGGIGVAYDEPNDRVVVVFEELNETDDDDEESEDSDATAAVKVQLSRAQVSAFVRHSREVVAAGRPACRFCGLPIDPDGHPCPRMN
ncbi:MAG: DUF3090 family protein [Acidimicrobiales bacterium]